MRERLSEAAKVGNVKFHFEATGIGSVPFTDPKRSCDFILRRFTEVPFWPQLPKKSYRENMYAQFSEGMPGMVIDEEKRTVHIDSSLALEGLEHFYERYLDDDVDYFAISPECASGLHEFLHVAGSDGRTYAYVKGQVTGPASLALTLLDENKRAVIHNEVLFESLTKLLSMKARWQIRKMKELCDKVIVFLDEPYLVSIGSSYVTIDIGRTMKSIDEVAGSIKREGAYAGLHCCGNTDWQMILDRDIDILSFDAYNFMQQFTLFKDDIKRFLARGGTIAWGIVPTISGSHENADGLFKVLKEGIDSLRNGGETLSALITPSCGTGTLSEEDTARVFDMTEALASLAKERGLC